MPNTPTQVHHSTVSQLAGKLRDAAEAADKETEE
jgi:hypothetical protein